MSKLPDGTPNADLRIRVVPSIGEIAAADWDRAANPPTRPYNPFLAHAFLDALETSQSAVARTGWQPQHLVAETERHAIVGVAPCYLKSHSRGEYVFDWGWADAYERAGGDYYPKLQVAVPFTPATGPRLLVPEGAQQDAIRIALGAGLAELCRLREASSAHVTFLTKPEFDLLGRHGYLQRTHQQF
ncbi:MAG: N-acetyltransferase, partial [Rhizobiales bacterium]|nr:N-acetyltransferase [Hyphomicrobiales bacterium]